ncbi:MAG TPA: hypothetical protein VLX92_18135 [Kofleriaceae bacterium]|nr:hypothetical protein [Kofleriaceae bacterium]
MNVKAFFGDALASALELGLGAPDDILRQVTADVLAHDLPRPLWARLLTACLGAPRVDAQLVVETIGVPNLCEHVPPQLIWAVLAEIAARQLGKAAEEIVPLVAAKPASGPVRVPLAPPPPETIAAPAPAAKPPAPAGPSIPAPSDKPLADLISELEAQDPPARGRAPTSQRFRQGNTGIGRPGAAQSRRPQAQASAPIASVVARGSSRRSGTEVSEAETETAVESADWRGKEIAVDDSQLVDWQADTQATDDDFSDLGGRKR